MFDYAFFLFAFSSLFTLIDPIGAAPIFVAYTDREGVIKTADNAAPPTTTICNYTRDSPRLGYIRGQAANPSDA